MTEHPPESGTQATNGVASELEDFGQQIADQVESFLLALRAIARGDATGGQAISLLLLEVSQILLAEDETRIASFVAKGLRAAGYASTTVTTGHEALDLVSTVRLPAGASLVVAGSTGMCTALTGSTSTRSTVWSVSSSMGRPSRV